MVINGKALILYATMTRNTEKIAIWFKESFEHYNFGVTMFRMAANADWKGMQEKLYFDDYDVVCLGSPIVAGSPLMIVVKALSLGGGGALDNSASSAPTGKPPLGMMPGGSPSVGGPPPGGITSGGPPAGGGYNMLAIFRRNQGPYMGVLPKNGYQPLGVVFTTYGGGFYGSDECLATLETLKLYLETNDVKVIGKFACCGKESGPAGLADGVQPRPLDPNMDEKTKAAIFRAPKTYLDADGNMHIGSFFFHTHMNSKPGPRDEAKAKALIADLVEDYFFSYDGERKRVGSQYISIS